MHSIHIAEWILALVTTRDRAASTVGDLMEGSAARGVAWFWSGVFRTAAALLWRDVAEHPARLIALAFLGLAAEIAMEFLAACLPGLALLWGVATGNLPHYDSILWKLWPTGSVPVSSLLIGRMLARWAPGRELAACVVYAILASIYNLVPMLGDNGAIVALLCVLIVPAGAAWGRRRRLRTT